MNERKTRWLGALAAVLMAAGLADGQTEFEPAPADEPVVVDGELVPAPDPERGLRVLLGYGLSFAPVDSEDQDAPYGAGVYLEAAKVWHRDRTAQPQLYAGLVVTRTRESSCTADNFACDVSSTTVHAGGKVRIMIPIPYIGPFLEVGAGFSAGRISSERGYADDEKGSGLLFHIPFALGLAFGAEHQSTLAFSYLAYPGKNHMQGALAVGFDVKLH